MPFVLGFIAFVALVGIGAFIYAVASNPNRKKVELDANHFDMASLLTELLAIDDRGGFTVFPSGMKDRAEQYVASYRATLTTNRKEIRP